MNLIHLILFVCFLFALGMAIILYLGNKNVNLQNSGQGLRKTKSGENVTKMTGATDLPRVSSSRLTQGMILEETGMLIPELSVAEPSIDAVKKRIEQGMEAIFPLNPVVGKGAGSIIQLGQLDPQVKRRVLSHMEHLKNFQTTSQLYKTLENPNVSMSELSKMIVTDPLLTGNVLKIANSAYFGMQQKVNSIGHALMIIGLLNVKAILYQDGLLKLLQSKKAGDSFMIESLWEHAMLTSICASHLQSLFGGLDKGTLFTLGLLHDIGKFVMSDLPTAHGDPMSLNVSATEFTIYDEEKVYGANHAVVGRLLFDQWGFPEQMGRIIERHHDLSIEESDMIDLDSKDFKYLLALFLSNQTAKLFASEDKSVSPIASLSSRYHHLVQKKKLHGLMIDSSLFAEIKKAKALAKTI